MQIVTNNLILKILSKIDIFELDLGNNLKGPWEPNKDKFMQIKIVDEFIKTYHKKFGNFIYKYGNIQHLKFYEDMSIKTNTMYIFKKDDIYEIDVDLQSARNNPRKFFSDTLQEINNMGVMDYDVVSNNNQKELPEDYAKIPNNKLPYDQYVQEMVAYRQKASPLKLDPKTQELIERKKKEYKEKYGIS